MEKENSTEFCISQRKAEGGLVICSRHMWIFMHLSPQPDGNLKHLFRVFLMDYYISVLYLWKSFSASDNRK
jgi:hypothetical protein